MYQQIEEILSSYMSGKGNTQRALCDLKSLLNEIHSWPNSLPGWIGFPETEPTPFPNKVEQLREELNGKINVLKAELDDQPTPPPGPTDRAA